MVSTKSLENLIPKKQRYSEPKQRFLLSVTPTGKKGIKRLAEGYNLSVSELIEGLARGKFRLIQEVE